MIRIIVNKFKQFFYQSFVRHSHTIDCGFARGMNLAETSGFNQLDDIRGCYAAGSDDVNPAICLFIKAFQHRSSLDGRRFATRGQQFVASAFYYLLQSLTGIAAFVKGTMESDAHPAGRLHSSHGFTHIDVALTRQETHHHGMGSKLVGMIDVIEDNLEIFPVIAEIAAARTYQHTRLEVKLSDTILYGSCRRRGAALAQRLTEFYAISSTLLGIACRKHRITTNFDIKLRDHYERIRRSEYSDYSDYSDCCLLGFSCFLANSR